MKYFNGILLVCNIALFIFWVSLVRINPAIDGTIPEYILNKITLQITTLSAVTGIVTLGLAVFAYIGFQTISERAEKKADEVAREVAAKYFEKNKGEKGIESEIKQADTSQEKEAKD